MRTEGPADPISPLEDRLDVLRRDHRRQLSVGGVEVIYHAVGQGSKGVLLLPGLLGGGEAYLPLAPLLKDHCRLLMVTYPIVPSLDQLLDVLTAMLDREGIAATAIVGGSFGGSMAQAFLQRFPERTLGVVLSGSVPASPERAVHNERWGRRLRMVPMPVIRTLFRLLLRKLFKPVVVDKEVWLRFYLAAVDGLTREVLTSRSRIGIDFDRHCEVRPGDLVAWEGDLLILEGSEDSVARAESREALKATYPGATVHTFEGAGHGPSLERPEEWRAVVSRFLLQPSSRAAEPAESTAPV